MNWNSMTYVLIALIVGWVLQLGLSLQQMRRFYRRIDELRKIGRASVGLEGNQYKGRVYTVLVLDDNDTITHAEKLTGITVFANLNPVPELVGQPVSALMQGEVEFPIHKKVLASFRKAAEAFFEEPEEQKVITDAPA